MAVPVGGIAIAAISLIPGIIASYQNQTLQQLKQCEKFPSDSTPSENGYYYLRGPLHSKQPIKIDINTGSFVLSKSLGAMSYQIEQCVESKHVSKHKVEDQEQVDQRRRERKEGEPEGSRGSAYQPGAAGNQRAQQNQKEDKYETRSRWKRKYENIHQSPMHYASMLEINGINVIEFKELFPLQWQYEVLSASPYLNDSGAANRNENVLQLNLNINTGSGRDANADVVVGEVDRKIVGYRHVWKGVEIGDEYTVIGYWNGEKLTRRDRASMVSKHGYSQLIRDYEQQINFLRGMCFAGLVLSGVVGVYEMKKMNAQQ